MMTATSGSRPIGAMVGATYGAETCVIVAAVGFLVQAALILTSPVPNLARRARRGRLSPTSCVEDAAGDLAKVREPMVEYAP